MNTIMASLNKPIMLVYIFAAFFVFVCLVLLMMYLLNRSYIKKLKEARRIEDLPGGIRRYFKKFNFSQELVLKKVEKNISMLSKKRSKKHSVILKLLILFIVSNIFFPKSADNKTLEYPLDLLVGVALVVWFISYFLRKLLLSYNAALSANASRLLDSEKGGGNGRI